MFDAGQEAAWPKFRVAGRRDPLTSNVVAGGAAPTNAGVPSRRPYSPSYVTVLRVLADDTLHHDFVS